MFWVQIAEKVAGLLGKALQPAIVNVAVDWGQGEEAPAASSSKDKDKDKDKSGSDAAVKVTNAMIRQSPQQLPPIYPGS